MSDTPAPGSIIRVDVEEGSLFLVATNLPGLGMLPVVGDCCHIPTPVRILPSQEEEHEDL